MKKLTQEVIRFFKSQSFVIVSTIDNNGAIHNAAKGLITLSPKGKVYLMDVYSKVTHDNLKQNNTIGITAIGEHKFKGYCLKGRAKILEYARISPQVLKAWEYRITNRITHRLLENIRGEKGHSKHPEALLPRPEYIIPKIALGPFLDPSFKCIGGSTLSGLKDRKAYPLLGLEHTLR